MSLLYKAISPLFSARRLANYNQISLVLSRGDHSTRSWNKREITSTQTCFASVSYQNIFRMFENKNGGDLSNNLLISKSN